VKTPPCDWVRLWKVASPADEADPTATKIDHAGWSCACGANGRVDTDATEDDALDAWHRHVKAVQDHQPIHLYPRALKGLS
jgi:hypothetical protein